MAQIEEAILSGSLKEGDKLPSERALEETFKVSRGTLREALRGLEQKGFIAIKTGAKGGAFVCAPAPDTLAQALSILLRHQMTTMRDLEEFREEIEGLVAARAAERANTNGVEQLREILVSIQACLSHSDSPRDRVLELDGDFHLALARMAGNKVYEAVLGGIYATVRASFDRLLPRDGAILGGIYQELCDISAAIERQDSTAAKSLLQRHIRRYYWMMATQEKQTA